MKKITQEELNAMFDNRKGTSVDLQDLDLSGLKLRGVDLSSASFNRVNLSGANLGDVFLCKAQFTNVNFNGANFNGAVLDGAKFTKVDFTGANMSGTSLNFINLKSIDLTKAERIPDDYKRAVKLSNTSINIKGNQKINSITEDYKIEAGKIIDRETYWPGQSADLEIAFALLNKGYEESKIQQAIEQLSPSATYKTDIGLMKYCHEITQKACSPEAEPQINLYKSFDEINSSPDIDKLGKNPKPKDLYNAYLKEELVITNGAWDKSHDRDIATSMLKNKVPIDKVTVALKHSPALNNKPDSEKRKLIKETLEKVDPELKVSRNMGMRR